VRAIAQEAGVDAALVHHFFGTKAGMFAAALELPISPDELLPHLLAGPREQIGERFARTFLRVWTEPRTRAPMLAVLRSATTNEEAAAMLRQFIGAALLGPMAEALGVPPVRLAAAASQLIGLVLLRHVIAVEPLASATDEEVVGLIAPVIQRHLDGEAPTS
jgi:AcrR family transcriptional regulator